MSQLAAMMGAIESGTVSDVASFREGEVETNDPSATTAEETSTTQETASSANGVSEDTSARPLIATTEGTKEAPPKPTAEDAKYATRFAALARENNRQVEQARQLKSAREELDNARADIARREAELHALLRDPEAVFRHLDEKLGVRNLDDLRKFANKAWEAKPREAPISDKDRPMTRRELEEWEVKREAKANRRAARQALVDLVSSNEEGVASIVYGPKRLGKLGSQIASGLQAEGKTYTLQEIADLLEAQAKADPRYSKIEKRFGKSVGAKSANPATAISPTTAPRAPIPGNSIATSGTSTPAGATNGAARMTHRERIAKLMQE